MEENKFAIALEKKKMWMVKYGWMWITGITILIILCLMNIKIPDYHSVQLISEENSNRYILKETKSLFDVSTTSKTLTLTSTNTKAYHFTIQKDTFNTKHKKYVYVLEPKEKYTFKEGQVLYFEKAKNILQLIIDYYVR